jgi:predicted nucleic acid-binding protein
VTVTVVDASVLAAFYAADDPRREAVIARMGQAGSLQAPAHIDIEVVSALRGMATTRPELRAAVPAALRHLAGLPMRRVPLAPLLERVWALRGNLTSYDAAYIALAELLDAPLLTCDGKLAAAPGLACTIDLIA